MIRVGGALLERIQADPDVEAAEKVLEVHLPEFQSQADSFDFEPTIRPGSPRPPGRACSRNGGSSTTSAHRCGSPISRSRRYDHPGVASASSRHGAGRDRRHHRYPDRESSGPGERPGPRLRLHSATAGGGRGLDEAPLAPMSTFSREPPSSSTSTPTPGQHPHPGPARFRLGQDRQRAGVRPGSRHDGRGNRAPDGSRGQDHAPQGVRT